MVRTYQSVFSARKNLQENGSEIFFAGVQFSESVEGSLTFTPLRLFHLVGFETWLNKPPKKSDMLSSRLDRYRRVYYKCDQDLAAMYLTSPDLFAWWCQVMISLFLYQLSRRSAMAYSMQVPPRVAGRPRWTLALPDENRWWCGVLRLKYLKLVREEAKNMFSFT